MIDEKILNTAKPGAKVKVYEGAASAPFEGLVIARKHGTEPGATITVRSVVAGVGVEKIFPVHSPNITKIEIISAPGKVHRSKLYFVRKFSGAKTRQRLGVSI